MITNDRPGIESFENLSIQKDSTTENGYVVTWYSLSSDTMYPVVLSEVSVLVTVVMENGEYKVDEVKGLVPPR